MDTHERGFDGEAARGMQDDLREQVATLLLNRVELLTADTVAIFPFSGADNLDQAYCTRLGNLLVHALAAAIRSGRLEARTGLVVDLHRVVLDRGLTIDRLFTFVYLIERTTLDELALHDRLGATSEAWPLVAQLIRRASFDALAAYVEREHIEPGDAAIIDRLTTLYTGAMFDAVFAKELERAGRFGYAISLIVFDVDRLSAINKEHGYGVGDRILERLGILIRKYFRQHDWVARHSEDSIAVLLVRTEADQAFALAEKVRSTVEERLGFTDHRSDRPVVVTVTAAVLTVQFDIGDIIDPERLMADADAAIGRAKDAGRNRVVRVDGYT